MASLKGIMCSLLIHKNNKAQAKPKPKKSPTPILSCLRGSCTDASSESERVSYVVEYKTSAFNLYRLKSGEGYLYPLPISNGRM